MPYALRRSWPLLRHLPLPAAALALLVSCSADPASPDCGANQVEQNGTCVAADTTDTCGDAGVRRDGGCAVANRDAGERDVSDTAVDGVGDIADAEAADIDTTRGGADGDAAPPTDADSTDDSGQRDADAARDATDASETGTDAGCTRPAPERCDGRDNDCDGEVDERGVCPEEIVQNTDAFEDGVFFKGTTEEGLCSATALQQFWPSKHGEYYSGFGCSDSHYRFRRTDDTVFYHDVFDGIRRHEPPDANPTVETPPCGRDVRPIYGFDGQGRLYYRCRSTLRRAGTKLTDGIERIAVTLDDGRTVVSRYAQNGAGEVFAAVDADGNDVAVLNPRDTLVGTLKPLPDAATKSGNKAYVLFERTWGPDKREYVAYRLTPGNDWQLMRRLQVDAFGEGPLVVADGTIFINRTAQNENFRRQIFAYHPDGTQEVVWDEANASEVYQHGDREMLVGPKDSP